MILKLSFFVYLLESLHVSTGVCVYVPQLEVGCPTKKSGLGTGVKGRYQELNATSDCTNYTPQVFSCYVFIGIGF